MHRREYPIIVDVITSTSRVRLVALVMAADTVVQLVTSMPRVE